MGKTILKYGFGAGVVIALYLNIGYELGLMYRTDGLQYLVYLGIVIHPLAVFLALWELKRKKYNNRLLFVPALFTGVLTSTIAGLMYCFFTYVDIHLLDFRQYKEVMEYTAQEMEEQGKTAQEIEVAIQKMKSRYLSYQPYLATMKWYLKMGTLYTLLSYLLLNIKTIKNKLYETTKTTENSNSA
jgi:membrane protein required for beta-lactamase induction